MLFLLTLRVRDILNSRFKKKKKGKGGPRKLKTSFTSSPVLKHYEFFYNSVLNGSMASCRSGSTRTHLIHIHQISRTHVMATRCSHSEEAVPGEYMMNPVVHSSRSSREPAFLCGPAGLAFFLVLIKPLKS